MKPLTTPALFTTGRTLGALVMPLLAAILLSAQSPSPARTALMQGRVHEAEQMLRSTLVHSPTQPEALLLLCRVLYAEDRFDDAQDVCVNAAEADRASSDAQLWLGRVYGARASAANPLQAFALARKVHAAFERAVELNGRNADAMSDLGEYFVSAPAVVGGGVGKARDLAPRLLALDPVRGHRLLAQVARKEGNSAAEERESEAAAASGTPEGLVDLAIFRRRNQQPDLAVAAVRRSIDANRAHDESLVDAAGILIVLHREPQIAERALHDYLSSPARTDAAPAFKVHLRLARLLRSLGDTAAADRETAAARELAPEYLQTHTAGDAG